MITHESAFEANIEAHLLAHGWSAPSPASYDRKQGIFPDEVIAFVQASQPKAWAQLVARHGGEAMARQNFAKVVVDALDHRGTISVLRDQVKDSGVHVRLCFFKPASGLDDAQAARYASNRLGVVRQLHHSESNPSESLDMTLVVNGIPVATAELKNPLTHQTVEHAMGQYRTDRNPHDVIFARRTLVHFAVDPHRVAMTTKLAGQDTVFLPFNQGTAGGGQPGAAGNPPAGSGSYQTAHLWEQVWQRDAWLDLLGSFVAVQLGAGFGLLEALVEQLAGAGPRPDADHRHDRHEAPQRDEQQRQRPDGVTAGGDAGHDQHRGEQHAEGDGPAGGAAVVVEAITRGAAHAGRQPRAAVASLGEGVRRQQDEPETQAHHAARAHRARPGHRRDQPGHR